MKYSIKVNLVRPTKEDANVKGFATVVFGESFKISNIAIIENRDKEQLFVSMPRYRTNEVDERGMTVFKDVCHPITADFRAELYDAILDEFERVRDHIPSQKGKVLECEEPEFSVSVTPFEREGSNIRGFARIYFGECFVVNNVDIIQGREKLFISMPSFRTGRRDRYGKDIYQDVCHPVTKDFREKLYTAIEKAYEEAKELAQMPEAEREGGQMQETGRAVQPDMDDGFMKVSGEPLPFR